MKISEIIGLTITEIRYNYIYQNEHGLQEFFAFLKLSNGLITGIPQYHDSEIDTNQELNRL